MQRPNQPVTVGGNVIDPKGLRAYCEAQADALLGCLRQAVEIESPSQNKVAVDRLANFFAREFKKRGAEVRLLPHATAGSAVVAEFWGEARRERPILLLGHLDTVWDVGTLAAMPFRVHARSEERRVGKECRSRWSP